MTQVRISGNTYNCRDLIKQKGGKWDSATKTWTLDASAWDRLSALDGGRAVRGCVATALHAQTSAICPSCGTYCYGDCEVSA